MVQCWGVKGQGSWIVTFMVQGWGVKSEGFGFLVSAIVFLNQGSGSRGC